MLSQASVEQSLQGNLKTFHAVMELKGFYGALACDECMTAAGPLTHIQLNKM